MCAILRDPSNVKEGGLRSAAKPQIDILSLFHDSRTNTINTICSQICLPRLCGSVLFISDEFSRLSNTFRYPLGNFLENITIYNTTFSAPKRIFENWLRGVSKTHWMKRKTPEMNVSRRVDVSRYFFIFSNIF